MRSVNGGAALSAAAAGLLVLAMALAPLGNASEANYVAMNQWDGFLGCGIYYPTAFQPITCPDPNNDVTRVFDAQPGLKTIVLAMEWEGRVNLNGAMRLAIFKGESGGMGQGALARGDSTSPIELRLDANPDAEGLNWDDETEPFPFTLRVWAGRGNGTMDVNIVYQQPFTVHYHLFYGDHAPDDYSALP
jgi:hypothetical protein